jgi:hypothetical protein
LVGAAGAVGAGEQQSSRAAELELELELEKRKSEYCVVLQQNRENRIK